MKSDYQVCHVCLSICMEQPGYHQSDFHEIWYKDLSQICQEYSSFIKIWPE